MTTQKEAKPNKNRKHPTYEITYDYFKEGLNVSEIAKKRELNESTIYGHLMKLHKAGKDIDLSEYINDAEINVILNAIKEVNPEDKALKPVFEHLKEEIPYWKIRMALYLSGNEESM